LTRFRIALLFLQKTCDKIVIKAPFFWVETFAWNKRVQKVSIGCMSRFHRVKEFTKLHQDRNRLTPEVPFPFLRYNLFS